MNECVKTETDSQIQKLVVTSQETQTREGLFGIKRDQTTMYKINSHCIGNTLHIAKDFCCQDGLGAVTKVTFSSGRTSQWFTRQCCQKQTGFICNLTVTVFLKNFIAIN